MPATAINELGWRQGCILSRSLARRAFAEQTASPLAISEPDKALLIVVSQDCDIVHHDERNEPFIELIPAIPIDQPEAQYTKLRNPRRLHFPALEGGTAIWLEAIIHHRLFVPREILAAEPPSNDVLLEREWVRVLVHWVARRYERTALPDQFAERFQLVQRKAEQAFEKVANEVAQVYIALHTQDELPADIPYRVRIAAAMQEDDFNNDEKRRIAQDALDRLERLLRAVPGIVIDETDDAEDVAVRVVSETAFTLSDLHAYRIWDFDKLSFKEGALASWSTKEQPSGGAPIGVSSKRVRFTEGLRKIRSAVVSILSKMRLSQL